MFFNVALLIGLGILCLIGTVLALIFGVIALANNTSTKFVWLTVFLCSLIGMIICIVMGVRSVVHAVEGFTESTLGQFDIYRDSLNGHLEVTTSAKHEISPTSAQIKVLKSYLSPAILNNEPEEFYTYSGFKNYNRYPLRYPFSIHCMNTKDNGELYNEVNVNRFNENDNGEVFTGISNIYKMAFDKNYLLIEELVNSTRTDKTINHYILFNFETEKKEEAPSLSKLLQLAKEKGYTGPHILMTLEQYHQLF